MRRVVLTAFGLSALACADSHGTVQLIEQRPVIEVPGAATVSNVFEVPATITPGQAFTITYATFGSSSCSIHLAPEVSAGSDFLLVIPRLKPIGPGMACTDDIAVNRHTITTTWPGARVPQLRVILRGYRFDGTGVDVIRTASMP